MLVKWVKKQGTADCVKSTSRPGVFSNQILTLSSGILRLQHQMGFILRIMIADNVSYFARNVGRFHVYLRMTYFWRIEALWHIYASANRTSICSDNALPPIRCQAIIWTYIGLYAIGIWEVISVQLATKHISFHTRNCIWKCHMRNVWNLLGIDTS